MKKEGGEGERKEKRSNATNVRPEVTSCSVRAKQRREGKAARFLPSPGP